jgi:hypothetical protein
MAFKIIGGTRSDGEKLCPTCTWAQIIRGAAESQEIMRCGYFSQQMPFFAVECSKYQDKRLPDLQTMLGNCYILEPDRAKVGFGSGDNNESNWTKLERKSNKVGDDDLRRQRGGEGDDY